MGCFSYTCGISNLPIEEGDKVRYFLIAESPYPVRAACYIHDVWWPRTIPLKAEYDSYGGVVNVELPEVQQLWLETFWLDRVDVKAKPETLSFQDLVSLVSEEKLFIRDGMPLFPEGDLLSDLLGKPKEEPEKEFKKLKVESVMILEDVWQETLTVKAKEVKSFDEYKAMYLDQEIDSRLWPMRGEVPFTVGTDTMVRMSRDRGWSEETKEAFTANNHEFQYVKYVMSNARHWWRPSYPCGPQFGEWDLHSQLLDKWSKVAKKYESRQVYED